MSSSEIRSRHEKSMMKVLPKVVKCLEKFFGGGRSQVDACLYSLF